MGTKIPLKYQKIVNYQILQERRLALFNVRKIIDRYKANPDSVTKEDLILALNKELEGVKDG